MTITGIAEIFDRKAIILIYTKINEISTKNTRESENHGLHAKWSSFLCRMHCLATYSLLHFLWTESQNHELHAKCKFRPFVAQSTRIFFTTFSWD